MIDGMRVVAFTPYGRERTVSILAEYMRREHERGIVDEWWLCRNTDDDQVSDLRYGYSLAMGSSGGWIKMLSRPSGRPRLTPKQRNTGYFYEYMTDPDTMFVRFDDDIVYVHPDAVQRLVAARTAIHDSTLAAFPVIWNNAVCSWYLQKAGVIPESYGVVARPYCMDPVGWADGRFAVKIHNLLLDTAETGDKEVERLYLYQDMPLPPGDQFSVSCFACSGKDYAALPTPGVLDYPEEEAWHTRHRPLVVGKSNVIIGNALVSHFTFMHQQHAVLATNILDRYRDLAIKATR